MKKVRRPKNGVVTRKLAEDLVVNTVFGNKEIVKLQCVSCKEWKLKSEFYLESKSKRKYNNQVRKQCVNCWDEHKGYMGPLQSPTTNTVLIFCDEV